MIKVECTYTNLKTTLKRIFVIEEVQTHYEMCTCAIHLALSGKPSGYTLKKLEFLRD